MNSAQLKTIQSNFFHELQDAYSGKKTSLPFIVHEISPTPIVKNNEIFESLVIGGTVAKAATLRKNGNDIQILDKKGQQLSFRTKEDFLEYVDSALPDNTNVLALNFAYPMTPVFENNKPDGIFLPIMREANLHGLVRKKVGQEIEKYIYKKRGKKITVSVANDTVCLLLSGLTEYSWHVLVGGVDGTGVNFAFFLDKKKLVNLESANFSNFPQSKIGKTIDKASAQAGKRLFEKETAGAYLYKHFNIIVKDGKINYSPINSTEELNDISFKNIPEVSRIARDLLKRSAKLVACQIAGITEFKKHSMVFNMEGSLFWKANGYRETVEQTVKQLAPEFKIKFVEIKNSGILGAAKLVS